ncbi:MAG: class I SAM-dependent methyltransferase, partial [Candidatus Omnitrophica bacterium]|nr:class I SAM-dependent methyltransferase [Candidatus Omnitrophota bacterium]
MGSLLNVITPLHKRAKRDYVARMIKDKVDCSRIARQYGKDYWDGDRKYGYGGYKYDGRWSVVAQGLIDLYKLPVNAKILDVGCGKGFLLYELKKLLPRAEI